MMLKSGDGVEARRRASAKLAREAAAASAPRSGGGRAIVSSRPCETPCRHRGAADMS